MFFKTIHFVTCLNIFVMLKVLKQVCYLFVICHSNDSMTALVDSA